jgi:hypothetical protein
MKIQCWSCYSVFDIECGSGDFAEETITCMNCNTEIHTKHVQEYSDKEYIHHYDKNIVIKASTKSNLFLSIYTVFCVLFSFLIIKEMEINRYTILLTAAIIGILPKIGMYLMGELRFTIGKESYFFRGIGKIGLKKKIDWYVAKEIYIDSSVFRKNKQYYIVFKGTKKQKINITILNDEKKAYFLKALQDARYKLKEENL